MKDLWYKLSMPLLLVVLLAFFALMWWPFFAQAQDPKPDMTPLTGKVLDRIDIPGGYILVVEDGPRAVMCYALYRGEKTLALPVANSCVATKDTTYGKAIGG